MPNSRKRNPEPDETAEVGTEQGPVEAPVVTPTAEESQKEREERREEQVEGIRAEQPDLGIRTSIPKERLIAESSAFLGQPAHIVAGALHDVEDGEELTIERARNAIERFLTREIA